MSSVDKPGPVLVQGVLDADGRLVGADPALADLHRRAGGKEGGPLAIPQVAALARLSRKLGIVISRRAVAADGQSDLELWVRAKPSGESTLLEIGGWSERPHHNPAAVPALEREADFNRAAADWAWGTDEALRITLLTPNAASAVGGGAVEFLGRPLTSLFRFRAHPDGSLPILSAFAERIRFENQRSELRVGTGDEFRLDGVPLVDDSGNFAGFRGSATRVSGGWTDIAASEHPEAPSGDTSIFGERIERALRDPLDHIITHAQTIGEQGEGPLKSDYAGYAADIASAGKHLLTLVDDLVDLQAVERPDFKPASEVIDIAEVARQAAHLLSIRASERDVRVSAPDEHDAIPALGEFRRALQIVVNLLTNAIRYSPEGGEVSIAASRQGGFGAITVSDRGKGIDPADQARVFEKFERVDPLEPGGTGLGLYIARRLARAMAGDLVVESAPGQGSTFTLTLPLRT